jgi:uncharacterized membrane protein YfhO
VHNPIAKEEGLILFSRAWYPGYRAFLGGKELEVRVANGLQPAVFILAQADGELVLRFAPPSVRNGLLLALTGLSLSVAGPGFARWRRS